MNLKITRVLKKLKKFKETLVSKKQKNPKKKYSKGKKQKFAKKPKLRLEHLLKKKLN
jgi:hypothetical protein